MKIETMKPVGETRIYHIVEGDGFVKGMIELEPQKVPLYSSCMGVRLMRHLPKPRGYCMKRGGMIV